MVEAVITRNASHRTPPALAATGDGRFVVLWNDLALGLAARFLRLDGSVSGEPFALGVPDTGMDPLCSTRARVGEGFWAAWTDRFDVKLRAFDGRGLPLGDVLQVSSDRADPRVTPLIGHVLDGGVVVGWLSADPAIGPRGRAFTMSGTPRGPEFGVGEAGGIHRGPLSIATLDTGEFAFAWLHAVPVDLDGDGAPDAPLLPQPKLRILDPTGFQPLTGEVTLPFNRFTGEMAIAALLPDGVQAPGSLAAIHGNDAGAFDDPGVGGARVLDVTILDREGRPAAPGAFSVTHLSDRTVATRPAIAAQPAGRFIVAWSEHLLPDAGDETGENVAAKLFSAERGSLQAQTIILDDGTEILVDPAIRLNETMTGDQTAPSLAVTIAPGGGAVAASAWLTDDIDGSGAAARAIRARIV